MPQSSSAPAPRGGGVQPAPQPVQPSSPRPALVPPKEEPSRGKRWAIFLVAAGLLGGAGYYWNSANATGDGNMIQVPTATVNVGDISASIRVNGTIAAKERQSILAPRIQGSRADMNRGGGGGGGGGRSGGGGGAAAVVMMGGGGGPQNDFSLVLMKLAKAGTRVKKGEIIAEFDPQMQIQRLEDYEDSLIQNEASLRAMRARLDAQRESFRQRLRSSQADVDRAHQDMKSKPVRSKIDQELYDLTAQEAEATLKQYEETDKLQDEQLLSEIRRQELTKSQSQLELERARQNVAKMKITSPIDGIVVMATTTRNNEFATVREGDEVRPGQPFMYIVDPSSMILNASVNQVDAEKLRLGMKAKVRLDAYSDIEVPATVDGIGAMAKTSTFRAGYVGEIPLRLTLDGMDSRIIPDLTASAEIILQSQKNAVVLPLSAVVRENGANYVYVKGQQSWAKKVVDLGLSSFTAAAVRSGVQKGEVVALQRPM